MSTFPEMVAAARARVGAVSVADAAASDAPILDVREANELVAGRIDRPFLHIPLGELPANAEGPDADAALLAAKDETIHVLCAVGGRAAIAAAALTDLGYDAKLIEGGFGAWRDAGLPTIQG